VAKKKRALRLFLSVIGVRKILVEVSFLIACEANTSCRFGMVSEQGSAPSKRFGGDGKGMAKASISEETCFGFYDSRRVTRRASQFPNSFVVIGVRTIPLGVLF
jgi:hypothetical protein